VATSRKFYGARHDRRQGNEIEAIVLQNRLERTWIARA